jgi:acyl carrier protein
MSEDERLQRFRALLVERFELDPEALRPDTRLYEDLDLDSIDAVDLAIVIREVTGHKIDPQAFRQVRTVGDVENEVRRLLDAS